jgi:hypothetical protein
MNYTDKVEGIRASLTAVLLTPSITQKTLEDLGNNILGTKQLQGIEYADEKRLLGNMTKLARGCHIDQILAMPAQELNEYLLKKLQSINNKILSEVVKNMDENYSSGEDYSAVEENDSNQCSWKDKIGKSFDILYDFFGRLNPFAEKDNLVEAQVVSTEFTVESLRDKFSEISKDLIQRTQETERHTKMIDQDLVGRMANLYEVIDCVIDRAFFVYTPFMIKSLQELQKTNDAAGHTASIAMKAGIVGFLRETLNISELQRSIEKRIEFTTQQLANVKAEQQKINLVAQFSPVVSEASLQTKVLMTETISMNDDLNQLTASQEEIENHLKLSAQEQDDNRRFKNLYDNRGWRRVIGCEDIKPIPNPNPNPSI